MKSKKPLVKKQIQIKEERKYPSKILFGIEKIDPTRYLSYYTLNSMSSSPKRESLPIILISNSQYMSSLRPQPKQKLVEDLLLIKKLKKRNKMKLINKTINAPTLNHTIENVSASSLLQKKTINMKQSSRTNLNNSRSHNNNTNRKSNNKKTVVNAVKSKMSIQSGVHRAILTESQDKTQFPIIAEPSTLSSLNSLKITRERSNSISSIKSNGGKSTKRRSNKNMNYVDYISTFKNRKSSKFTSIKHQNDFDSQIEIYNISNKIIKDFIGKSYESDTTNDGYSCFFTSTGNFHCPLFNIFGVVEGNGRHGKEIATLTRSNLHTYLTSGITYGFKSSKISEYEIYESITRNHFEVIQFVNERIVDDILKSNLDMDHSGASITVVFIINKKLICINVGDVRAVAFLEIKDNVKEILQSKLLSTLDVELDVNNNRVLTNAFGNKAKMFTGDPSSYSTDITEDYYIIIIASKHFWDNMTYGNVFKFMSTIQTDNIISKAEQIMNFKEKQNELYNRKNMPYSFCLIEF